MIFEQQHLEGFNVNQITMRYKVISRQEMVDTNTL